MACGSVARQERNGFATARLADAVAGIAVSNSVTTTEQAGIVQNSILAHADAQHDTQLAPCHACNPPSTGLCCQP